MYIELPCQACDKASIASARGSGTRAMNWGRCVLWTVANLWQTETSGLLSHSGSPECVWLLELCPESEATETDPLLAATGGGNGSHLVC